PVGWAPIPSLSGLALTRALGGLLAGSPDQEVLGLLALLDGRLQPSRPCSAAGPGFAVRPAVLRGDLAAPEACAPASALSCSSASSAQPGERLFQILRLFAQNPGYVVAQRE